MTSHPSTSTPSPAAPSEGVSRRAVVAGAGGVAAAGVLLTACGGGSTATAPGTPAPAAPQAAAPSAEPSASGSGQALAPASEIPVGGGKVFADQDVVVTQPNPGDYKAFSATCTHQGCKVNTVADGLIGCPCHGSQFKIADGSVAHGPAKKPLPEKNVAVQGGSLVLG